MEHLIQRFMTFVTGGASDFCALFDKPNGQCFLPLIHYWHGLNVTPLLYFIAGAGAILALVYVAISLWQLARLRLSALPALLMAVLYATAAYAASSTLGNLSSGSAISDTDLFYDVQSVGTGGVKVTGLQLKTYIGMTINTGVGATGGTCYPGSTCTIAATLAQGSALTASGSVASTDAFKRVTLSNSSSGQTLTLQAGVFSANQGFWAVNINTQSWAIADTGGTYTGISSIAQNQSCFFSTSDGTNWIALGCGPAGSSTITAGTTATSGITSGDIVGSSSNLIVDTGVAYANVGLLNGANAWSGNETHTGTEDFSGTTTPTMSAGHVFIGGAMTAPTFSATGQGAIWTSTTGGINIGGDGSTNSVTLTASGGNSCTVGSFGTFGCNNTITSSAANGLAQSVSANSTATSSFANTNAGSSAQEQIKIGNNISGTEAQFLLNSSANTSGNGANSFTISGAGGVWLQGGSTNALGFGTGGAITIYNQPTTGSITYAVCAASGANGTGGGALILDTSATVCGLSSMDFKRGIAAFSPNEMQRLMSVTPREDVSHLASAPAKVDPVAEIMAMTPGEYEGDGVNITDTNPQFGLFAQDLCVIDARLCIRDPKTGKPRNFRDRAVLALLVSVVQKQQSEIDALKRKFH